LLSLPGVNAQVLAQLDANLKEMLVWVLFDTFHFDEWLRLKINPRFFVPCIRAKRRGAVLLRTLSPVSYKPQQMGTQATEEEEEPQHRGLCLKSAQMRRNSPLC
jgi:hypothetical protein